MPRTWDKDQILIFCYIIRGEGEVKVDFRTSIPPWAQPQAIGPPSVCLAPGSLDEISSSSSLFFLQEIATALSCGKNIVPVIDGFEWPEPQALPEDIQAVLTFNGIK